MLTRMEQHGGVGEVGERSGYEERRDRDEQVKRRIRAEVRTRRRGMTGVERLRARAGLAEHLIGLVQRRAARTVTCYLPTADEPDPAEFLDWTLSADVEVLLPIAREDRQLDWARFDGGVTARGRHGILEPTGDRLPPETAGGADLMLIPAGAVDGSGTRLGWGLGYFDRCLAALDRRPPVFAVVFEDDRVPELPREPHDIPVDGVVTPAGVEVFAAGTG